MFLKGLIIGISMAAPIGPVSILFIQRTLKSGIFSGLISGIGSSIATTLYCVLAIFGFNTILPFLVEHTTSLHLLGALFLCYLGIKTFTSRPALHPTKAVSAHIINDFFSMFLLTLASPVTIFLIIAVFAELGFTFASSTLASTMHLLIGILLGSIIWWSALVITVGFFRKSITDAGIIIINRISGTIIFGFGCWILGTLLKNIL